MTTFRRALKTTIRHAPAAISLLIVTTYLTAAIQSNAEPVFSVLLAFGFAFYISWFCYMAPEYRRRAQR